MEMRRRARELASDLESQAPGHPSSEVLEAKELLEWMEDNHFTFLGYRQYRLRRGRQEDRLEPLPETGLGVLRPGRRGHKPKSIVLRGEIREHARAKDLLIVTKANTISTVHRATYLDYVSIKTFDAAGDVSGEHRFIGLWTWSAYSMSPHEIPVLRHKVQAVVSHFGVSPSSHDGRAVLRVLETYPRDELFQTSIPDLVRTIRGIVNVYERQQVRLFVRRDAFRRFYSCLIYVPRDRYNTQVRQRIEVIVRETFHARFDPRYRNLKAEDIPATESLKDTLVRVAPYWESRIAPELKANRNVLVVAHGNSLRALVKMLDGISDSDIVEYNIPTGVPLLYELDDRLTPRLSRFLGDQEAIKAAAEAVRRQSEVKK